MILLIIAFIFLNPIAFIISGSIKINESLYSILYKWIPKNPSLVNYLYVINEFGIFQYIKNSVFVTAITIILLSLVSSLAGYGFARIDFPGRDKFFLFGMASYMIPDTILIIPLFIMMNKIQWVDTFYPLIIPNAITYAYGVFIFRQFIKVIPKDIEDSAFIDGCNRFVIFFRIILPLVKPAFVTVVILGGLGSWNDYIHPLIYLNDKKLYTAQLALGFFSSQYSTNYPALLAAVFITVLPIIIIFIISQRYFIESVARTGIKM